MDRSSFGFDTSDIAVRTGGLAFRAVSISPSNAELVEFVLDRHLCMAGLWHQALGSAACLSANSVLLEPNMMLRVLVYAFAAATLGGLDSPKGAWFDHWLESNIDPCICAFHWFRTQRATSSGGDGPYSADSSCWVVRHQTDRASLMFEGQHRVSRLSVAGIVLLSVALAIIPFVATTTGLRQASQIIISDLAVLGVNVATGYGGMISLGHGVFVGVGAFATGYYLDDLSLPWLVAIALGAVTAGLSGALVGLPALRIKGIHQALVTLGMAIVFQPLSKRFPKITGGVSGQGVEARFDAPNWWPGDSRMASAVYRYLFLRAYRCSRSMGYLECREQSVWSFDESAKR